MWTINVSGKRILYPLLFIVLIGIITINLFRYLSPGDAYQVNAYPVSGGWGYHIAYHGRIFIDQPFIPLVTGKKPFPSRRSALKTGKLVLKRLKDQQTPVLRMDDLRKIGLDTTRQVN